jgi:hypothetical protein
MVQASGSLGLQAKPLQMRRRGPMSQRNDFERDRSIETFLPCTVNDALGAAPDFSAQLVIAEVRRDSRTTRAFTVSICKIPEASLEQTNTAKAAGSVSEDCSSAFCAHVCSSCHFIPGPAFRVS